MQLDRVRSDSSLTVVGVEEGDSRDASAGAEANVTPCHAHHLEYGPSGRRERIVVMGVDPGHNAYLAVIVARSGPLGEAMLAMTEAAGKAAASLDEADLAAAEEAMEELSKAAGVFLRELTSTHCPSYLSGPNEQLQGALQRVVRGGDAGAAAANARDGALVAAAARDIDLAADDMVEAAQRITNWRGGAKTQDRTQ